MRLSAYEGEDGYEQLVHLRALGARIEVWIDGVKMKDVEMADESTGEARRTKRDATGLAFVCDGELVRETLHGHVVIEITKP